MCVRAVLELYTTLLHRWAKLAGVAHLLREADAYAVDLHLQLLLIAIDLKFQPLATAIMGPTHCLRLLTLLPTPIAPPPTPSYYVLIPQGRGRCRR